MGKVKLDKFFLKKIDNEVTKVGGCDKFCSSNLIIGIEV